MASGPTPLGELLSSSWASYTKHFKTILVGAIVFAVLLGISQWAFADTAIQQTGMMAESITGLSMDELEDLSERMANGDEEAIAALEKLTVQLQGKSEEELQAMIVGQSLTLMKGLLPAIGISIIVSLIVGIIVAIYYLILAIEDRGSPQSLAKRVPALFFPVLGLSIWVFLRTFAWIPVLGIILFVILGPRFVLSQVLLVRDGKGVFESASLSYKGTRGYWGKIAGNMIVLIILMVIASVILTTIFSVLGGVSSPLAFFGQSLVQLLVSAYAVFFSVKLAVTILKHPLSVAGNR